MVHGMSRIEFFSPRFHYSFGPHPPTINIATGTALCVICPDCDNALSDGTELSVDHRDQDDPANSIQGNPLAGPIYVEGAQLGDTLAVKIEAVELDRSSGITLLAPNHGVVPSGLFASQSNVDDAVPRHMYHWHIDKAAGTATIANPLGDSKLSVPLNPFVGCIGVCPSDGTYVSSLHCGGFGGNLDLPMFRAGATVFLPVNQEGALLMLGDIHAAQGHGEIIGGGIETSGKIHCAIRVIKRSLIGTVGVIDGEEASAIGMHDDVREAIQQACGALVNWLAQVDEMNRFDLYNAISQTVTITLGNLNKPPYPAAASVSLSSLPDSLVNALQQWID
jgi:amidase